MKASELHKHTCGEAAINSLLWQHVRAGREWGWDLVPGTGLPNRMTHHTSTMVKHFISYFSSEHYFKVSVPLNTTEFSSLTVTARRSMWEADIQGIMTWHVVSQWIPQNTNVFVTDELWAAESGKHSTVCYLWDTACCSTPQMFVTWLHSFGWNPAPLTLFTSLISINQVTCHGNNTHDPTWYRGPRSAPTGQRVYAGRVLPSDTDGVSGLESPGSGLPWWSTQMGCSSIR